MNNPSIAMRDAFLERILQEMTQDHTIYFVTADFVSPVLDRIRSQFPDRFVNVGIAEQNLINIASGLAIEGFKVFAYAIATFITMRCYEQIRINLALLSEVRDMNVTLIGVGAGFSYVLSGPSHQCCEDLTIMRALPNIAIYSPADHVTTVALFDQCVSNKGIKYLRLDAQMLSTIYKSVPPNLVQGFHIHRHGVQVCLLATGYMLHTAFKVADELAKLDINVGIIDLFDISHFVADELETALSSYAGIVTMEEGFRSCGGIDCMMFEFVAHRNMKTRMLNIGVQARYRFELGTRNELHEEVGIGPLAVIRKVIDFIQTISAKALV